MLVPLIEVGIQRKSRCSKSMFHQIFHMLNLRFWIYVKTLNSQLKHIEKQRSLPQSLHNSSF